MYWEETHIQKKCYMFSAVKQTLLLAAYNLRHELYDVYSVTTSVAKAQKMCLEETDNFKTGKILFMILERAQAVYFKTLATNNMLQKNSLWMQIFPSCCKIAYNSLTLFDYYSEKNCDVENFIVRAKLLKANAERIQSDALHIRFGALSRNGTIFKALPEIEYISYCSEISAKCERLIDGYFLLNSENSCK